MSPGETSRIVWAVVGSIGAALLITLVVELTLAAAIFGVRTPRDLALLALVNAATNPALNVLLASGMALLGSRSLGDLPSIALLALLESVVVLVEWRAIAWVLPAHRRTALAMSLTMNAASLVAGLAVFGLR